MIFIEIFRFRFIFLSLLCFFSGLYAQDVCPQLLIPENYRMEIEGAFVNREASRTHISIEWKHYAINQSDSFFISFPNSLKQNSLLFITNGSERTLFINRCRETTYKTPHEKKRTANDSCILTRQMAQHHLKEFIGNTPLRFDDLELLANGAFLCPSSNAQDSSSIATNSTKFNFLRTAYSQMWYTLKIDTVSSPQSVTFLGCYGAERMLKIIAQKEFDGILLPAVVQISSKESYGTLWIRTAWRLSFSTAEAEIPLVFKLNQKLLRHTPIIETIFGADKKAGSESQAMFPFF